MAKQRFGGSAFRKLTGISAETLRHYEERGVLGDVEVAPNNYKKYDARNVVDALHARMCRGLDLGLSQIVHKADYALDGQEALLLRHEEALKAQALELDLKIGRVRQQAEFLSFARANLGKVVERSASEVPSLYRLLLFGVGPEASGAGLSESAARLTEAWMSQPQYAHVAIRIRREALLDPGIAELPLEIGIGMREEYATLLKLDTSPPVEFFPGRRNLGTVIAVGDPLRIRRHDVENLLAAADSLGVEVDSDLVGRLCTSIETDRGRAYYFSASFCIK